MRKAGILFIAAMLLSGCAAMTTSRLTANNRMSLMHLSQGMSKPKALAIMGSGVKVYKCDQAASKTPIKVTINNPYQAELIEVSGATLEVVYYVTGVSSDNCVVGDDNLTPLVFKDGKLIGWGKNFLSDLISISGKSPAQPDAAATSVSSVIPEAKQSGQAAPELAEDSRKPKPEPKTAQEK